MEKIKYVHRQDSGFKLSAGNSGETSLNLSNEIFDLIAKGSMQLGEEKDVTLKIYKEDCIRAICFIILKLPLYQSSSNASTKISDGISIFQKLIDKVNSIFGERESVDYTVNLYYRIDGRIYLNRLKVDGFSIRDVLVENNSALLFREEPNGQIALRILSDIKDGEDVGEVDYENESISEPNQIIYFGAPGTGKSFRVEQITEKYKDDVIRTTFHPDSDYSTFVGCYKPSMESIPQTYTIEGKEKPIIGKDGEQVTKEEIVYSFVPQAFTQAYTKAWLNPGRPIFLVIEELNRGNCAQIFGDIFQLLDRNENNESAYSIIPDHDLQQHLVGEFKDAEDIPSDIKKATAMRLPSNLYIWATMNTSDQSLFPIDSAFKRRWIWKYIPIADAEKGYKIKVGDHQYDWWTFVEKVNGDIELATKSEDKKLGYFFAKADNGIITADTFVSKVVFYLWNDVFKDSFDKTIFKNDLTFHKFFEPDGEPKLEVIDQFMHDLELKADGEE